MSATRVRVLLSPPPAHSADTHCVCSRHAVPHALHLWLGHRSHVSCPSERVLRTAADLCVAPLMQSVLTLTERRADVISYFIYVAFNFGVAFAPNIETLVICRFFDGLAGSAFLSVAGGTVSDIFAPSKVAKPMGVYTACVVPLLIPLQLSH